MQAGFAEIVITPPRADCLLAGYALYPATGVHDELFVDLGDLAIKDGADVHEGDVLFEIDSRTYHAEVDRADANLALAEAHLGRLENDFQRADSLAKRNALSPEELDKVVGDRAEAAATVRVAKAGLSVAKTNLDYTKIKAPITGRISRTMIDPGNLVKADETPLTVIVSKDPMFAYFDIDERTLL